MVATPSLRVATIFVIPSVQILFTSSLMASLLELRTEALPHVRIGLIGLGQRGMRMIDRYRFIDGASIVAISDRSDAPFEKAQKRFAISERPQPATHVGAEAWREVCDRSDVDLIYICTPWDSHAEIAQVAMMAGKHVAVEVPAAMSVEDCWALIGTARRTNRHLFLAENCCYDRFHLGVLSAVRQGLLGTITHCEGAYLHDLRADFGLVGDNVPSRGWMGDAFAQHGGNPYPTHAIGPIAHLLNIHRGDRLKTLTAVSSTPIDATTGRGRINTALLTTEKGRTILLQLDMTTPRPYSRLQTTCGTEGYAQKYPLPTLVTPANPHPITGHEAEEKADEMATYHPAFALWQEGYLRGVDNEMNYAMDARLIYCLCHGLPLDIDAYDAAEWSCLTELTQLSAQRGGAVVEIPDFTEGAWDKLSTHQFHTL